MDLPKVSVPLSLVVAALGIAATSGGTLALANARQTQTAERVDANVVRLQVLEQEARANRERVLRIEILAEQTNKTVERIERKVSR